jgi:hypothetical protein
MRPLLSYLAQKFGHPETVQTARICSEFVIWLIGMEYAVCIPGMATILISMVNEFKADYL